MQECAAATWTGKVARYIDERLAVKTIPLTRGYEAIVDDEDFEELSKFKWCAVNPSGKLIYARRSVGDSGCVYMHRQLMPDLRQVDHVNRDGLDNRRANLRGADHSQNQFNTPKRRRRGATSKFKGVSRSANGRWRAHIGVRHKNVYIGTFDSEVAAANAYDQMCRAIRPNVAHLNFPYGIG